MILWGVGLANVALGVAYLFIGLLALDDFRRGRKVMGFSHFGAAFVALAFTCGPHHLVHGTHVLVEGRGAGTLDFATTIIGVPAGAIFVMLRLEAMFGGRGDRFVSGTPWWLASMPLISGVYVTALVAALIQVDADVSAVRQVFPNLTLIFVYAAIGYFIFRSQIRNRPLVGGWSLSGLSIGAIFPTCSFMHLTYALYAASGVYTDLDWHGWLIDYVSIPAALYFLWVVRGLYRGTLSDWNRFNVDSVPARGPATISALETKDGFGVAAS